VLGLDAPVGSHWRVGGVLAGGQARLARDEGPASASIHGAHAGLSAQGSLSGVRVVAGVLHGWRRIHSRRQVSAGPLWNLLSATYTARSWQAFVEFAPHLRRLGEWGNWLRSEAGMSMSPYLRHEWVRLQLPGYQEKGGEASHGVLASSARMHATTLGWRWRYEPAGAERPIRLEADLGWRHAWGDLGVSSRQRFGTEDAAFGPPSRPFSSNGLPLARHAVMAGLGASVSLRPNMQLSARYSGLYGSAQRDHAAWAELRWAF